jgi:hypothetical protein
MAGAGAKHQKSDLSADGDSLGGNAGHF